MEDQSGDGYVMFLRHGPKAFKNRKGSIGSRQLDTPLTTIGKTKIYEQSKLLIEKYGCPDMIISSPFCRTRQTADILSKTCIKHFDRIPEFYIDSDIGEYLGYIENPKSDEFFDETLKFNPIIDNDNQEFDLRVKNFLHNINVTDKKIIIVTHGLFVQKTEQFLGYSGVYPGYYEGFVMTHNNTWDMDERIVWST